MLTVAKFLDFIKESGELSLNECKIIDEHFNLVNFPEQIWNNFGNIPETECLADLVIELLKLKKNELHCKWLDCKDCAQRIRDSISWKEVESKLLEIFE